MADNSSDQSMLEPHRVRVYLASRDRHQPLAATPYVMISAQPDQRVEESLEDAAAALAAAGHGSMLADSWLTSWFAPTTPGVAADSATYDAADNLSLAVFGVLADGTAVGRNTLGKLTWGDIWRAAEDGLYPRSVFEEVVITDDGGWGGDLAHLWLEASYFLTSEIGSVVTGVITSVVSDQVLEQARRVTRARQAPRLVRRQARMWSEQGLAQPRELLDFLYRRPRWSPQELARRLRIDPDDAEFLLTVSCDWDRAPNTANVYVPGRLATATECLDAWEEVQNQIEDAGNLPSHRAAG